jgi:hypothetical protein
LALLVEATLPSNQAVTLRNQEVTLVNQVVTLPNNPVDTRVNQAHIRLSLDILHSRVTLRKAATLQHRAVIHQHPEDIHHNQVVTRLSKVTPRNKDIRLSNPVVILRSRAILPSLAVIPLSKDTLHSRMVLQVILPQLRHQLTPTTLVNLPQERLQQQHPRNPPHNKWLV